MNWLHDKWWWHQVTGHRIAHYRKDATTQYIWEHLCQDCELAWGMRWG
jgi:hypothetical protein